MRLLVSEKLSFTNAKNEPLSGGRVRVIDSTSGIDCPTFSDWKMTTRYPFPIILDVNGEAEVFYDGRAIDVYVTDQFDKPVWSIRNMRPMSK